MVAARRRLRCWLRRLLHRDGELRVRGGIGSFELDGLRYVVDTGGHAWPVGFAPTS